MYKSQWVQFFLTLFIGPFGLAYVSITGACIFAVISVALAIPTGGISLIATWPLMILVGVTYVSGHNKNIDEAEKEASIKNQEIIQLAESVKICEFCAETIKTEAKVCRYCGRDLPVVNAIDSKTDESDSEDRMNFEDYVSIEEFSKRKGIDVSDAIQKIKNSELKGRFFQGSWYMSRTEIS